MAPGPGRCRCTEGGQCIRRCGKQPGGCTEGGKCVRCGRQPGMAAAGVNTFFVYMCFMIFITNNNSETNICRI